MGWPAGRPRPKAVGRRKGTPNRKTQLLMEICEAKGISPFEGLLELCVHPDVHIRLGALREACQYLYPKRKAIEISGEMDMKLIERVRELDALPDVELLKLVGK